MSLASQLIDKGVNNIDVSMLPEEQKKKILTDVAELLYNQGRLDDAAEVISKSGNHEKQTEFGVRFLKENKPSLAVHSLLGSDNFDLMRKAGIACMNANKKEAALLAFSSVGDTEFEMFVKENL